jgi:ankyrin repeat protein
MDFAELIRILKKDPGRAEKTLSEDKRLLRMRSNALKEGLLAYAATENWLEAARMLIRMGAKVNDRNASGETPLIMAASLNHPEMVRLLLDSGADLSLVDGCNDTALSRAVRHGSMETARILVEAGADTGWRSPVDETLIDIVPPAHKEELDSLLHRRKGPS